MSPRRPADEELDGLLAEWSAAVRLTPREAEAVRVAVVAERPEGLDPGWWAALMGRVSATVIEAVALPPSARAALAGRPTFA